MNNEKDYHFSHWDMESLHELGFKKGERYWIRGWGWMKLDKIERHLLNSDVISSVTYHFIGCDY